jgi:enoyl-CoA hydratase/carnithine racemase
MSNTEAPVLTAVRNRIGHLTLNRPGGLNALTLPMIRCMRQQLQAWADDPQILAVVLRAAGEKAFCAGGDIRALYDSHLAGDSLHWTFFEEQYALDGYIHAYRKPFLALMDGLVLGGGMGLVQGASLRVISERVKMAMPEVCIGYFPDVGASYFLSRLPGELGTYFGLTGVQVRTADALYAGLADVCLPNERLAEFDRRLDNLTWTAPAQEALAALLATLTIPQLPGATLQALRPAIDEHFAQPDLPAIRAALLGETRPEFRDWAAETVRVLDSRSPLAMSVTLELLRRGRNLPLSDCFALERHLGNQWFARGDFIEGVRALIIDKDQAPQWNPTSLAALDPARVQAFFVGAY